MSGEGWYAVDIISGGKIIALARVNNETNEALVSWARDSHALMAITKEVFRWMGGEPLPEGWQIIKTETAS